MKDLNQQLQNLKVVPVIVINNASKAEKLAQVLIDNSLPCAEVTLRTPQAIEAIKNMRKAYPELLIGAGTVLTTKQVDDAIDAGVDFIVSPGLNPVTVTYCQKKNVVILPGVNNPSLVEQAMALGLNTVKFFPAEPSGGLPMLKALASVYPVKFMPTGGINPKNVNDYLALSSVIACGGSWMVPTELVDNEQWDELAILVAQVASIVN